jgi:hypothetical protein
MAQSVSKHLDFCEAMMDPGLHTDEEIAQIVDEKKMTRVN